MSDLHRLINLNFWFQFSKIIFDKFKARWTGWWVLVFVYFLSFLSQLIMFLFNKNPLDDLWSLISLFLFLFLFSILRVFKLCWRKYPLKLLSHFQNPYLWFFLLLVFFLLFNDLENLKMIEYFRQKFILLFFNFDLYKFNFTL